MGFTSLPRKWQTLIAIGFGTYMATMDFSIVNVALPTFSREFNHAPDTVVWVALGTSMVVTGLTLTAGRAGDLYGRKRVYLTGWFIFTIGVTLASFAQSLEQLIALRLLQAVGISLAIANSNAIVTDAFPDHERGRALGTVTSIVGAGLMSGPIVGGLILAVADWRAIFWARIPIGLLAIAMGYFVVREAERERQSGARMDIPGAVLLFAALATSLTAINRGAAWGWTSPIIIGLGVVGLLCFIAFARVEGRSASPVLSLALFKVRAFAASLASLILNFVGQSAVIFLMPFYLIEVRDFSTAQTGFIIASVPVMLLLFAPFSGAFHDRKRWPHQTTLGVALVSIGLFSLATLSTDTPVWLILAQLAFIGLGSVIFNPPNTSTIMGSVPRSMLGTASASVATGRNVGNALGLAVASAVLVGVAGVTGAGISAAEIPTDDLLAGIRAAFLAAATLSLLAIIASSIRGATSPLANPGTGPQTISATIPTSQPEPPASSSR